MRTGRPKGSKDKQPRKSGWRKLAESEGMKAEGSISMPELMRQIALRRWERGDEDGALIAAEKAAPYFAPKLSATTAQVSHEFDVAGLTDAELARELAALGAAFAGTESGDEAAYDSPLAH